MIRALIFDCFGVLYWDEQFRLYNLVRPDQYQELTDIVHACDYGYVDSQSFLEQVAALADVSEDDVAAVLNDKKHRNDKLIERVFELKQAYKIGLLSNMGSETTDQVFSLEEQEKLFDSIVVSSMVGMIKPSRDIYEFALEQLGVKPEETVFIDDRPANTDGAERVGMKTILYTSNAQFEKELKALVSSDA